MRRFHWVVVAFVGICIVALPLWFAVRGTGAGVVATTAAGAASERGAQGGNLRSGGGRVFVGGGSRAGK